MRQNLLVLTAIGLLSSQISAPGAVSAQQLIAKSDNNTTGVGRTCKVAPLTKSFNTQYIVPGNELSGSRIAASPIDKWVLPINGSVVVITENGQVLAHDIDLARRVVNLPYQLSGPAVAVDPQDKWVFSIGNSIVVVTDSGQAFAYDVDLVRRTVSAAYQLSGSKVTTDPQDKWVLPVGGHIVVITQGGQVSVHDIDFARRIVSSDYQLSGPPVAAYPEDKQVFPLNGSIALLTDNGQIFVYNIDLSRRIVRPAREVAGINGEALQDKRLLSFYQCLTSKRISSDTILAITLDGQVFVGITAVQIP
ncbi:MAG: hypothetical protein JO235_06620 [Chroococcidiopsidaceae cyanobacterium CP_BM_RX_35]|nr:hypothetical protein [Chroococcidiopsidaceae cyanobacterium CP_BM_RX_35]